MTDISTFNQPTKILARRTSLKHAVELLTSRREHAAIVPEDHVRRVRDALLKSDTYGYADAGSRCSAADIVSWQEFRAQSIGKREPGDLTVAYFAGPEPSNDLLALLDLGLRPENIWAFEVKASAIEAGLTDLERLNLRGVKFIPVGINQYFAGTPRRFDIIYIDACAPLPSPKQATTKLIADVFRHSALAPLGVLVTNFAKPDISKKGDLKRFSHLIASYLYPKGFMEAAAGGLGDGATTLGYFMPRDAPENEEGDDFPFDEDKCFVDEVGTYFERYYGAFITRHIMDIAAIIAPTARLIDSGLFKILFSGEASEAAKRAKRFVRPEIDIPKDHDWERDGCPDFNGEAFSDPSFYTLLWTLADCGLYGDIAAPAPADADVLEFAQQWINQLPRSHLRKLRAEDVVAAFYAWRHDNAFWSDAMRKIAEFPYMEKMPFLCDVPLPEEIGFYPAFAQLAYPAHANVREAKRLRYVAEGKKTEMFMDVLVFDECRYVYDWLSALHLVPGDWEDLSAQLTFRFALDSVAKNARWFWDDFLFGCHVVGVSTEFPAGELGPRKNLSPGKTP